jgi:hypothetical protein
MTPRFRRVAAALGATATLLLPTSANAANAEHVEWTGYGWSDCTSGTSTGWTCYYDVYSSGCVEAAVLGTPLANCELEMHATVRIVPMFNAAGRVVGCTSVSLSPSTSGYVYFNSTFAEFDNYSIDSPFTIAVFDAYGDGTPSAVEFTAHETGGQEGTKSWTVEGAWAGSCNRNRTSFSNAVTGTVDVAVA